MRPALILVLGTCLLLVEGRADTTEASDEQLLRDSKISTDGAALLQLFRDRTLPGDREAHVKALIAQLGDDDFDKREQASQALVTIGKRAVAPLQKAVKDPDLEVAPGPGLPQADRAGSPLADPRGRGPDPGPEKASRERGGAAGLPALGRG